MAEYTATVSEHATADPLVGRLLDGRYQIRSRIARGGMATVYLATDLRLERRVAVKVMHGHLADDAAFRERFIREARSAARLAHPNVVAVFDQGEDKDMAYLVMEYLPGITLRELLQEHRVLTTEQTFDIMEAVLSGLAAAHRAGIVHRDLKPENVMLADDGRIKIGDFGLARAVSANTATGAALLGTIAYLSPELVTRGTADARSDIYAIGIMMYEMLTGEQPFKGEQPVQIAYQHANDSVPAPSARNPRVPAELDELVLWATARSPEDRPADARALLDQLFETHSSLMTSLPGTGSDTGHRTAVFPGIGRQPTGETTLYAGGFDTGETQVLGGRGARMATQPTALVSNRTAALAIRAKRKRGRGPLLLVLVLVLALAAGGGGWWFGFGPGARSAVPSGLEGMSVAAAELAIQEAELVVGEPIQRHDPEIPEGLVVTTEPGPGESLLRGSEVQLVVSLGPRSLPVPQVIGLPEADALAALTEFTVDPEATIRQFDAEVPSGSVIDLLGPDGSSLREVPELLERSAVTLVVSVGAIPDVTRQLLEGATSLLNAVDLRIGAVSSEYSDDVPKDTVIRLVPTTDPVRVGDTVDLVFSDGPAPIVVPQVVGLTWEVAKPMLREAGFELSYSPLADISPGQVIVNAVTPNEGTEHPRGTVVQVSFAF